MAVQLFLNPTDEVQRKANRKMFKQEKAIKCPICLSKTVHEHEDGNHWIHCSPCKEVFEVSPTGAVWKFCQGCSKWEYDCTCLPPDDC